jgi:hypothetical protein
VGWDYWNDGDTAADGSVKGQARLGAVSFLHRFGSALNHHVHLRASCLPKTVAGPANNPSLSGHAFREAR